jgi:hypothetical protein
MLEAVGHAAAVPDSISFVDPEREFFPDFGAEGIVAD